MTAAKKDDLVFHQNKPVARFARDYPDYGGDSFYAVMMPRIEFDMHKVGAFDEDASRPHLNFYLIFSKGGVNMWGCDGNITPAFHAGVLVPDATPKEGSFAEKVAAIRLVLALRDIKQNIIITATLEGILSRYEYWAECEK